MAACDAHEFLPGRCVPEPTVPQARWNCSASARFLRARIARAHLRFLRRTANRLRLRSRLADGYRALGRAAPLRPIRRRALVHRCGPAVDLSRRCGNHLLCRLPARRIRTDLMDRRRCMRRRGCPAASHGENTRGGVKRRSPRRYSSRADHRVADYAARRHVYGRAVRGLLPFCGSTIVLRRQTQKWRSGYTGKALAVCRC